MPAATYGLWLTQMYKLHGLKLDGKSPVGLWDYLVQYHWALPELSIDDLKNTLERATDKYNPRRIRTPDEYAQSVVDDLINGGPRK